MKVALITGGSRGIGAETVKLFARNNFTVILNYHTSKAEAESLRNLLVAEGCDVHLFCADVSVAAQVDDMFAYVKKTFKHIDVLVNNAGISLSGLCQDVSEQDYDRVMSTNAKATFLCSQRAVEIFVSQGGGAIVNVSSIWGVQGASCESVYSMSKHAVVGLTRSLAEELDPSGITVNCVCPPIVLTDMSAHLSARDIEEFCALHGVAAYTPQMVAEDIFRLAVGNESGIVFLER